MRTSFLTLSVLVGLSHAFVNNVEYPKYPNKGIKAKKDVTIVIAPGFCKSYAEYTPMVQTLKKMLLSKDIKSNFHILKYTLNVGHRYETYDQLKKIIGTTNNDIFLIGHSMGAFALCKTLSRNDVMNSRISGLIQYGSHFNSKKGLFYDTVDKPQTFPYLTLLGEMDEMLPVLDAIDDDDLARTIVLEGVSHNAGLRLRNRSFIKSFLKTIHSLESDDIYDNWSHEVELLNVCKYMVPFIEDPHSLASSIQDGIRNTTAKYQSYIASKTIYETAKWVEILHSFLSSFLVTQNDTSAMCINHHKDSRSSLMSFMALQYFPIGVEIFTFSQFIATNPTRQEIHSYTQPVNKFLSYICRRCITNPDLWVKFRMTRQPSINPGRMSNEKTLFQALSILTEEDRKKYFKYGKQITFKDDFMIPLVPGCSSVWICTPLLLTYTPDALHISSPVLWTHEGHPKPFDSRLNMKILSVTQCLEWILVKSFM